MNSGPKPVVAGVLLSTSGNSFAELMEEVLPMKRFTAILLLSGSLLMPVAGFAEEHHRYHDRDHRDWHVWNDDENQPYPHSLMPDRPQPPHTQSTHIKPTRHPC